MGEKREVPMRVLGGPKSVPAPENLSAVVNDLLGHLRAAEQSLAYVRRELEPAGPGGCEGDDGPEPSRSLFDKLVLARDLGATVAVAARHAAARVDSWPEDMPVVDFGEPTPPAPPKSTARTRR